MAKPAEAEISEVPATSALARAIRRFAQTDGDHNTVIPALTLHRRNAPHDRPHQALEMRVLADVYTRSPRVYRGLEEITYPFHDATFTVTQCGRICFKGRKVNLSYVLAGQNVGVTQVGERIWLVTFMQYDLGYFDDETCRLEPIENPFGPKVLPMCSE